MKKASSLLLIIAFAFIGSAKLMASGGTTEVLYFKAKQGCCETRACDALEKTVQDIIEKNFSSDQVVFKQIDLSARSNTKLVRKYNAKSQTIVVVTKKGRSEKAVDISEVITNYNRSRNLANLEKELVEKIKEAMS